ncbi:DUF4123 domain-containing protein [Photobacterium sp.]|uniref:DUF4123 domain-containing protein n=1 Tax=Photobacterium sp. TaxID=660 RepID=UPI00299E9664|nr:DUF4123 domain-containing protein [Photobacterium sp.]MDX1302292.1 DUF4123 domain-containing protein [Photobacterium sp.]
MVDKFSDVLISHCPLYLVLDTASYDPGLLTKIYNIDPMPELDFLFSATQYHSLAMDGPVIVQSTERLLEFFINEFITGGYAGFAVQAKLEQSEVAEHLKRNLTVCADGKECLFRFYEPRYLSAILSDVVPEQRQYLMGNVEARWIWPHRYENEIMGWEYADNLPDPQIDTTSSRLALTPSQLAQLQQSQNTIVIDNVAMKLKGKAELANLSLEKRHQLIMSWLMPLLSKSPINPLRAEQFCLGLNDLTPDSQKALLMEITQRGYEIKAALALVKKYQIKEKNNVIQFTSARM